MRCASAFGVPEAMLGTRIVYLDPVRARPPTDSDNNFAAIPMRFPTPNST